MSQTHDYDTVNINPANLTPEDVLVGECGGLSAVFDVRPSGTWPDLIRVETEHGPLYLDPDPEAGGVDVLA